MDASTTYTLESFINYKNLDDNIYYHTLSVFETDISRTSMLLSYNVLNDYKKEIKDYIFPVVLTDEEYNEYAFQPKKLALALYGSTEYYYIILFINGMTNVKEFSRKQINLLRASDLSKILSDIYMSESSFLTRQNEENTYINLERGEK